MKFIYVRFNKDTIKTNITHNNAYAVLSLLSSVDKKQINK